MSVFPARGELTDALLAHLREQLADLEILVGDGVKPAEAGWRGQPNAEGATYVPYDVLATGDGTVRNAGTVGQPHASWAMTYLLDFYGTSRPQADWLADKQRAAALAFTSHVVRLADRPWRITAVRFGRLGSIRPNHAADPPLWGGQDSFALWIDANRG